MLDALKADTSHEAFKRVERLSERVWKLVEDDEFDEQPHLYLIRGEDKLVLFDTGTGRADLHAFIRSGAMYDAGPAQPGGGDGVPPPLPLLVINSHCHFDHIGSNHRFSPAASGPVSGVSDLCMGGGARSFSEGYNSSDTSLGKSAGCEIHDFRVTRWLDEGEVIPLGSGAGDDDAEGARATGLEVLHLPGHTPDSSARPPLPLPHTRQPPTDHARPSTLRLPHSRVRAN